MSNEIKYVNEAGVRRIITDTRARLTDLTTDMDSAFGFSLDLSDIATNPRIGIDIEGTTSFTQKTISFSLPKEFNTDEYEIIAKVRTYATASTTKDPDTGINYTSKIEDVPIVSCIATSSSGASLIGCVASGVSTVSLSEGTTIVSAVLPTLIAASREIKEITSGSSTSYECHYKYATLQVQKEAVIHFTKSNGIYSLAMHQQDYNFGSLTHTYGNVADSSSYAISNPTTEYDNYVSTSGVTYKHYIGAIEILVRKKLEATVE